MSLLFYILIFSFLESLVSFIGVVFLIFRAAFVQRFTHFLISFAIGGLIGAAFFDILPEAFEITNQPAVIFSFVAAGIVLFFILEQIISWYHHHNRQHNNESVLPPSSWLILAADALHNFLDGVVITIGFLVSPALGIASSFAVILHEIPQEIGDFSILLAKGLTVKKALYYNFLVSLTTIFGALMTYIFSDFLEQILPYALGIVAGNFIYIALSDLVPEIHEHDVSVKEKLAHTFLLIAGILIIGLL